MIEILTMIAAVGISFAATYAWKEGETTPALLLYAFAFGVGLQSIRTVCGG